MRILILGGDGYLGWPTAMYFSRKGHEVAVVDNFNKRKWALEMGVKTLIPIATLHERINIWQSITGQQIGMFIGDLTDRRFLIRFFLNICRTRLSIMVSSRQHLILWPAMRRQ